MADHIFLSIDCGTQSLRVLAFTETGFLAALEKVEYEPYVSPVPGWAEQDPDVYWKSLCLACRRLSRNHPGLMDRVTGVGVTSQRHTMINLDAEGRPLRPAIVWLDQRKAMPVFARSRPARALLRVAGLDGIFERIQSGGKGNWIRQNQPEIWEKTRAFLQVSGFINFRLTHCFKDSVASQIGYIPFNYRTQRWAGPRELAMLFFPVEPEKLPELVNPGQCLGEITREASEATGLNVGIPVIACGSDKGCETLGSGVTGPDTASLSFGTTATVQTTTGRYVEPLRFIPAYPAACPGMYNPEIEIFRGYWMITWFKNEFAAVEVDEARELGVPVEKVLDRLLGSTAPGAMGLMVQPYWSPCLGHRDAKGAMIGFGDIHGRAHVYRAVIEGLGFALREGLETLEKRTRHQMTRAAVSGGASQSDEICQITADILNRPLVRGETHETSGLGAAILTAVGLGMYPDAGEAVAQMVRSSRVFEPSGRNSPLYESLYKKVYLRLYRSLEPLYREIREITGYPA